MHPQLRSEILTSRVEILVGNPQDKKHEAGLRVDGVKHQHTSHRNKIRNCWTEWAYYRALRQGFVSRAMNLQAAHNKD